VPAAALITGTATTVAFSSGADSIHSESYPFTHKSYFSTLDKASVRRGYQVYKEVCSTCHSASRLRFREMEGVTHTKEELVKMAADFDIVDGPDDEGEMFERPGKLFDAIPGPYKNEEAARAANGGAYPPDLSLIAKSRHGGADYIFALLTGYEEKGPHGKSVMPGLYYNPYFSGAAISMPPPLMDGQIEYEDGTPCTTSQMAKDVAVFLTFVAEPEHDERKREGIGAISMMIVLLAVTGWYKRYKWSPLKTRKISYVK
jgi:ubiquinol-cytochrome c reductase cytochrome c1 subunit